ncbi:bromodomain-containing protein 4 [Panicum miliaceum]|uniref:Bromodomain-containing protein 4 n=1 Tax=Panicum miliaceum TaxID=4540 RepID=A0A3L6RAQ1_PANMI|nr:bromodomain-containing protein 4 [Panicum miliaceum]
MEVPGSQGEESMAEQREERRVEEGRDRAREVNELGRMGASSLAPRKRSAPAFPASPAPTHCLHYLSLAMDLVHPTKHDKAALWEPGQPLPLATQPSRPQEKTVLPLAISLDHLIDPWPHPPTPSSRRRASSAPPRRHSGGKSGFEAPRNRLDLDADNPNDIKIGVQIEPVFDALARTNMRRPKPTAPSSEAETPRTDSLIARLTGIDGLPDSQQPSPSAAHHKKQPAGRHSSRKQQAAAADKENHSRRRRPRATAPRRGRRSTSSRSP